MLEKFNRDGLRDAYNVLSHLQSKRESENTKGGKPMVDDPKKPVVQPGNGDDEHDDDLDEDEEDL